MSNIETMAASARAARLPSSIVRLRFADLKEARIVTTHKQLRRRIERDGFPPGAWTGENVKTWGLDEVQQWLASRSATRADTPQIKAARRYQRRLKRERAAKTSA